MSQKLLNLPSLMEDHEVQIAMERLEKTLEAKAEQRGTQIAFLYLCLGEQDGDHGSLSPALIGYASPNALAELKNIIPTSVDNDSDAKVMPFPRVN